MRSSTVKCSCDITGCAGSSPSYLFHNLPLPVALLQCRPHLNNQLRPPNPPHRRPAVLPRLVRLSRLSVCRKPPRPNGGTGRRKARKFLTFSSKSVEPTPLEHRPSAASLREVSRFTGSQLIGLTAQHSTRGTSTPAKAT